MQGSNANHTSAAFFLSIEFQQTGNLVRSFYVAALDRPSTNNMPGFAEFLRDAQAMQLGVVVGEGTGQQTLNNNRDVFMKDFVTRAEFVGLYPTTDTPAQYVDKLYQHARVTPTVSERDEALAEFGSATTRDDAGARGRALLRVTQDGSFQQREMNRSFVQMQYIGYLQRNPNDLPTETPPGLSSGCKNSTASMAISSKRKWSRRLLIRRSIAPGSDREVKAMRGGFDLTSGGRLHVPHFFVAVYLV
jgi:hypothetical protein